MRRARVWVAAVAAGVSLVAGCGGGEDAGRIVRAAATKTAEAQSSRMAITVGLSGGVREGTTTVTGAFDYAAERGRMTMDLSSVPGAAGLGTIEAIVDGRVLYMRFPEALAAQLPGAKPWVKIDLEALGRLAGVDVSQLGSLQQSDPTQALQYLRGAADDVEKVGTEDVRGVSTTRYRATLDLEKAAASLSGGARKAYDAAVAKLGTTTLPAEVWVDDEGRARKMTFEEDLSKASGERGALGTVTITMELYDFGVEVDATPPAADQVGDLGALLGGGSAG